MKQIKLFLLTLLIITRLEASSNFAEANTLYKAGNYKESFKIFQELAKDDPDAAYMLAYMYEHGEGCEIDKEEASKWYKISAQGYHEQGIYNSSKEVEKKTKKIYSSLDRLEDSQTQETIRQYVQSLYNFKAHNANYFLPISHRYGGDYADTNGHEAKNTETEFQFSVKYDFITDIFHFGEIYSVAYTQKSFWQFYSNSAFFRESNYNPEFFVTFPTSELSDGRLIKAVRVGIAHESNGRGLDEERSWNYISGSLFMQYKMLFAELKLWARLPDITDYNHDLIDYMGHGYLKFRLPYKKHFADLKLRHNFKNKGSAELNYSYPVFGGDNLFLYVKLFNGYGESLIDYDNHIKKFGIGFSISR
ncbi:MAG: phospholipase A [Sulfurimonas sp.]|uniref:phospholipase A n=1 Tax=Sulfurimonas sp. TaxID=2022749 RepID=UPI0026137817|nr:phospholipase A [Sulfurimonas sp.]MCW8896304.1 phospholipase A [Sulfurimonas sp.]MCW8954739.1 phospholipase A [Sulfurimonas sp.]MCW9068389.1 phospholipase A [Sulfurimonas sp.]